ncbi:MAG: hypothetical protein M3016_03380 [Actinomycetota bacterium]|nr:hypothetical protein [Actinomycetota bacterium]
MPLAALLLTFMSAGLAQAATRNPFACRASVSATRPSAPLPTLEPYVANRAGTPCATDSAGASPGSTGNAGNGNTADAGPAGAYTYSTNTADQSTGAIVPGAAALASTDGGRITNTSSTVSVAGPAQARATYTCVNGKAVSSGSADVSLAVVNGQTVRPSSPGAEQTTQLGGGSYVTINQKVQTATSRTERLVFEHIAGVGDYVLGEAQVALTASNGCAGTAGAGVPGSGQTRADLGACPNGSTLIARTQLCEIVQPGRQDIVVSRPFMGPTGGTVLALSVARKRYRSACLHGPGPKFAVVGTRRADRINGTRHADRILGLAGRDRIAGRGGNDCIDAGAGNDRIWAGKGKQRVYGGAGSDRISVQGGSSNVYGGAGNDRIFVRNGKGHVYGGRGKDRLYVGGRAAYANGGPGRDVAYVTRRRMRYARRHGCEIVHRIRTRRH